MRVYFSGRSQSRCYNSLFLWLTNNCGSAGGGHAKLCIAATVPWPLEADTFRHKTGIGDKKREYLSVSWALLLAQGVCAHIHVYTPDIAKYTVVNLEEPKSKRKIQWYLFAP